MDFTSKASKRRERFYFYINSDKFLSLNDLYRLGLASLSEPLSPEGKARNGVYDTLSFYKNVSKNNIQSLFILATVGDDALGVPLFLKFG